MKSFRSNTHRRVFLEASRNMSSGNYAALAAVYLLTADCKLWNQVKHCMFKHVKFKIWNLQHAHRFRDCGRQCRSDREDNGSANAEALLKVVNNPGFDLPDTGDNGTMMLSIIGIVIMAGAALGIFMATRKKPDTDRK